MFGLLSSDFGLLLYWVMGFDLCQRRDEIFAGASDVMGSISNFLYSFFFIFYLLRIRGLAVSELPVMGSPWASLAVGYWAWFCHIYIYIYIYFHILVQIFFGFFFFGLKVEQIIDNFFFFFKFDGVTNF